MCHSGAVLMAITGKLSSCYITTPERTVYVRADCRDQPELSEQAVPLNLGALYEVVESRKEK